MTGAERQHTDARPATSRVPDARPSAWPDVRSNGRAPHTLRRLLEDDGHRIDREGKLRCPNPAHSDERPSCHVYDDDRGGHAHCFACGYHLDAFDYMVEHRGMGRREAVEYLDGPGPRPPPRAHRRHEVPPERVRECSATALPDNVVTAHLRRAERLDRVPAALSGRGFTIDDLRRLKVAAEGEAAVIPVTGPDGQVLRLKRRAGPNEDSPSRYRYLDAHGQGTPAWCSPGWGAADVTLIVEGELNAAICWCVRPDLDVVGVAGTSGSLPLTRLARRPVVLYADGDEAGRQALDRWARALHLRGCPVSILSAWDRDACDVAGQLGRDNLLQRLA